MSPAPRPDVILVGGGVISCATAYFLAKEGLRPLIVEREAVGYGASGAAAGLLSPLADLRGEGPTTELGLVSLRLHRELALSLPAESGIDYHFSDIPVLRPAFNDDEEGELREAVRCQQALGLDVSWADQNGLLQIDEGLAPEAQGALHSRVEAQVEPYRFVLALTAAVERMGGAVRYANVTGVQSRAGRATGVRLADGSTLEAGATVLAMGPWTREAEAWTGLRIPIEPLKGQLVRLQLLQGPPPAAAVFWGKHYLLPKPAGYILAGTTEELVGFDTQPTAEAREAILGSALRFMPALEDAVITEHTACLRPLAADHAPVVGAAPGWEGLFIGAGHGRKGILQSVATGRILTDLVVRGHTDLVETARFSPARWGA